MPPSYKQKMALQPLVLNFESSRKAAFTSAARDSDFKDTVRTVRQFYLRRQYRQCANQCMSMLSELGDKIHPVEQTFLYFFAGLANDALARGMPNRSPLLAGTIDDAESYFMKALQTLPTPLSKLNSRRLYRLDEQEESSPTSSSKHYSLESQTSVSAASTAATSVSGRAHESSDSSGCESSPVHKPSPLNIRKYAPLPQTPSKQITQSTSLFSLSPTTGRRAPPQKFSFFNLPTTEEMAKLHQPSNLKKFHEHLTVFAEMLAQHLSNVQAFRRSTQASQDMWRRPSSLNSDGAKEMDPEEKMLRIRRGRERNWSRPRFDAQRYYDLCEKALAEL